jgi:hypothetical protein
MRRQMPNVIRSGSLQGKLQEFDTKPSPDWIKYVIFNGERLGIKNFDVGRPNEGLLTALIAQEKLPLSSRPSWEITYDVELNGKYENYIVRSSKMIDTPTYQEFPVDDAPKASKRVDAQQRSIVLSYIKDILVAGETPSLSDMKENLDTINDLVSSFVSIVDGTYKVEDEVESAEDLF